MQRTQSPLGEIVAVDQQTLGLIKPDLDKLVQPGLDAVFDLLRKQRFKEAGAILDGLLPLAPEHPEIWHWLGFVCWKQGKIDEARQLMEYALGVQPDNTIFLVNLGIMLTSLGKPATAILSNVARCKMRLIDTV